LGESEKRHEFMAGLTVGDIVGAVRAQLESATAAREVALRHCRAAVQLSSKCIRALHRADWGEATRLLTEARGSIAEISQSLSGYPELYYAGYVHDAQKEYVEAAFLTAILCNQNLPRWTELGVGAAAVLNGLAEAASELRRSILDLLKAGDTAKAERLLAVMEDVYWELISCDFPDAVSGGLRRTTDALRAVLERTHGDVALAVQQRSLEKALERYGRRV